ncbi:MAG: pyridoxal phosphate-dependent aminotransferase [Candidatus Latescibacteria bacterium]|nr:pyridoxal phosphate-dependent aminotransferase [Candidatus Latescibacterota bacterium]
MGLSLSDRTAHITQAEIRVMTIECEKVGGVNLAQGVCDLGVPREVMEGTTDAIARGYNSYTRYDGLPELREAISGKLLCFNGIHADPSTEVIVSAGSTGSFYCACLALLNPGDEVILFEPFYGYHVNTLLAANAVPRYVKMRSPDWRFDPADLERAVTPRTKGIVVCTPGNPSGKVYDTQELRWVADFATKHDLFIFTDEIYEYFVYDDRAHVSPLALDDIRDRTVMISGYSKTYSITGWRIGYSVSQAKWADAIGHVNDLIYVCAPAPLQMGVAAGIGRLGPEYYASLREEFRRKRDLLCAALKDVGLTPTVSQGAYYVLADVSHLPGADSKQKAMHLLAVTGVASVPGSAFYVSETGDNLVRFCFAKKDAELEDACYRLRRL